jgi:hypothetical protein
MGVILMAIDEHSGEANRQAAEIVDKGIDETNPLLGGHALLTL